MSEVLARLIERPVGPSFDFGGYRVTRSATHLDDTEIFRFRYRVYLEAGFIVRDSFLSETLRDELDSVSVQVSVRDSFDNLVGVARFVRPSTLGFHTEKLFDFDFPPVLRERAGEFGRLAISGTHRGGDRIVMLAILKAVFESMIESRTTRVLAFLSPKLADSFADLGCKPFAIRVRELGPASLENRRTMQPYFDSQSVIPVLYDLDNMLRDVGVRRNRITLQLQTSNA